jgi:hypothetical protein
MIDRRELSLCSAPQSRFSIPSVCAFLLHSTTGDFNRPIGSFRDCGLSTANCELPLTPIILIHASRQPLTPILFYTYTSQAGRGAQLLLTSIATDHLPRPMTSASLHPGTRGATMTKSRPFISTGKHFYPLRCLILRADKGWALRPTQLANRLRCKR